MKFALFSSLHRRRTASAGESSSCVSPLPPVPSPLAHNTSRAARCAHVVSLIGAWCLGATECRRRVAVALSRVYAHTAVPRMLRESSCLVRARKVRLGIRNTRGRGGLGLVWPSVSDFGNIRAGDLHRWQSRNAIAPAVADARRFSFRN